MITTRFIVPTSLKNFLGSLGSAGRHNLFATAANAVCNLVRTHIASEAPKRHISAGRLGAAPTGHLEKAERKTVFHADANHGEVVIPAPGFGRAFHDVTITPKNGYPYLTIPSNALSYGLRAKDVKGLGWTLFRPPAKGAKKHGKKFDKYRDILMGTKGGETRCLYLLKKRVQQRQDRSLLPSDDAIRTTAARAMLTEIRRVARKAG